MRDTIDILHKVLEIYHDISYENKHRSEISRSIATAYITKKNIPQSVQDAMKRSSFMDYFKFVEFDEDIDLKSVKIIEKEFDVLNHAYFMGKSFKNVSLRFCKLGKHKAIGLYSPTLHTLCVDIRYPSSFVHEYFHMIDDQLGDLSLEVTFNRIAALYKEAFLQQMDALEDNIKSTLNGKSKYNIQYFFRRAEIFARYGEIYFSRILKVKSSLIKLDRNSSAFGFLLQASSHAEPLRGGLMQLDHYAFSRTLQHGAKSWAELLRLTLHMPTRNQRNWIKRFMIIMKCF